MFSIVAVPIYIPANSTQGSLFSTSSPILTISVFLIIILTGVAQCHMVVLICVSLVIDVEHLFLYLLGICISSLEKCLQIF